MEFRFNINEIFKSPIVEINQSLIPSNFNGDRRALRDTVNKVSEVINSIGEASAAAQGLNKSITTAERLRNSDDQTIYLLVDQNAKGGKGIVTGMLKTGKKSLYLTDDHGENFKVTPPCLLDFYIHESRQRGGLGKQLFQHMIEKEQLNPEKLAIDRPSEKLLSFLKKHYNLSKAHHQMNNYVVFDGFFPDSSEQDNNVTVNDSSTAKTKYSANGLQPFGRYGAPRPHCSMGQIIHQETPIQSNEISGISTSNVNPQTISTNNNTVNYQDQQYVERPASAVQNVYHTTNNQPNACNTNMFYHPNSVPQNYVSNTNSNYQAIQTINQPLQNYPVTPQQTYHQDSAAIQFQNNFPQVQTIPNSTQNTNAINAQPMSISLQPIEHIPFQNQVQYAHQQEAQFPLSTGNIQQQYLNQIPQQVQTQLQPVNQATYQNLMQNPQQVLEPSQNHIVNQQSHKNPEYNYLPAAILPQTPRVHETNSYVEQPLHISNTPGVNNQFINQGNPNFENNAKITNYNLQNQISRSDTLEIHTPNKKLKSRYSNNGLSPERIVECPKITKAKSEIYMDSYPRIIEHPRKQIVTPSYFAPHQHTHENNKSTQSAHDLQPTQYNQNANTTIENLNPLIQNEITPNTENTNRNHASLPPQNAYVDQKQYILPPNTELLPPSNPNNISVQNANINSNMLNKTPNLNLNSQIMIGDTQQTMNHKLGYTQSIPVNAVQSVPQNGNNIQETTPNTPAFINQVIPQNVGHQNTVSSLPVLIQDHSGQMLTQNSVQQSPFNGGPQIASQ